jgi:hypothetical protein
LTPVAYYADFGTATNLLATGCVALAKHAERFGLLLADRSLVWSAVEESLRHHAPVYITTGFVRGPVVVAARRCEPVGSRECGDPVVAGSVPVSRLRGHPLRGSRSR